MERSDALIHEEIEFPSGAKGVRIGGNVRKDNRPPAKNFDGCVETILVLLRRVFLFCRRSIGEVLWLWLLLRRCVCGDGHQQSSHAQSR